MLTFRESFSFYYGLELVVEGANSKTLSLLSSSCFGLRRQVHDSNSRPLIKQKKLRLINRLHVLEPLTGSIRTRSDDRSNEIHVN